MKAFMERIDFVNDDLKLIQKTDGLTFGTDALLLASYVAGSFGSGCELGGGSGIISLLLLTRKKVGSITALEVQEEYAELINRNAELNGLSDKLLGVHTDLRDYRPSGEFDIVFSNPPYMKTDSGRANALSKKNIARHEVMGGIDDFAKAARRMLKFGGSFYAVYRTDRAMDLFMAMRNNSLEPKRLTMVHADTESEPSMLLVEGKVGGRSGLTVTKPFIIYKDAEHRDYTRDMDFIMENGIFPPEYKR